MANIATSRTALKHLGTGMPALSDDARWRAVSHRDPSADGAFVSAVRTTGIYCRPSCAARPHRKNVSFYATNAQAEAAGYRACLRCRAERLSP